MATIDLDRTEAARSPARRARALAILAAVAALGVAFVPLPARPVTIVIHQTTTPDGYLCEITENGTTVVAEASTVAPPDCRYPR